MFLAAKLRVWLLAFSLAAGWIVPSCQVVFQAWFLIKIWMITWRNSFARKPPNLLVSKPPSFNFAWLPTKFLILFGGQPQFLKLVGEQPFLKFWSVANPFFLKLVGEQPILKFWSVANHNFWKWSVSNHFSNFGWWPTLSFWNWSVRNHFSNFGWWPTIFLKLVGEQPFLKIWSVANHNFWNWFVIFLPEYFSRKKMILPKPYWPIWVWISWEYRGNLYPFRKHRWPINHGQIIATSHDLTPKGSKGRE